ncbi:MAG: HAD-IA family hydrolase, partial [Gammaproteobacteria bacterium]|nr:HAD-IA family hydrolase [Gammaproteobacteria bacterium]
MLPTLILDMDGTLLDLNFDDQVWNHALPRALAALRGESEAAVRALVAETLGAAKGSLAWYCLDHWEQVFGISVHALELELAELIALRRGTLEFLEFLRTQGYPVIIATNAHPGSLARKMLHTGIEDYFAHRISAHTLGVPKEDPVFWSRLCGVVPFLPEQVVFVDDNLAVLDSARRWGIRHLFGVRTPSSTGAA